MKWFHVGESPFSELKSNENIFFHTAACNPVYLVELMLAEIQSRKLEGIKIYHLHLEGPAPHVDPKFLDRIETNCFFVGKNCREAVQLGRASYIPVFLSEIPLLFEQGLISLDWALFQISPFDQHGHATLGPSVDISLMALHTAKKVVVQMNKYVPRVLGDAVISERDIDFAIALDRDLPQSPSEEISEVGKRIGAHVANLVQDGATLQMGIGEIPNAVLQNLTHHKDLGVHTEMFSDGLIPLIQKGVISNRYKKIHPYKVVSSFAVGSTALYEFLNDNPLMQFMGSEFVNDPRIILKNPKVCAINSALEVDLTGQVCADSIGPKIYSGVGGQVDFLRGAALSPGGRAIIALPSRTGKGQSKIVSSLRPGAGVVSTRAHIQYVATEWGVADLRAKSIKQRIQALIEIAHPEDRERLTQEAHQSLAY